ncbi:MULTISPECIES: hypothetical protein [Lysinibacillus]|uniref:Uncharacterized protein n=1 Tax=Lysinibacillus fusiformis TaxID=28031 RepID=A0A2I0V5G1_9BACI|nr:MULTISPECIES: hypothetical protein [Lysinibacillus]MEE3806813.1 hypothetical protein [Lysinibacillus fusiformis]PKU53462.1 hypothetical protein CRI88_03840 [Lysinibacillus fusiformis]SCX77512.1 hypothetical protein SAMN02787078_00084 [Lysinibacillus sp. SG9]SDB02500.1 hypothetical protein SAMN02787079_00083 [Lysinibacillus sp. TC-37]SFS30675.1 hypothetical protein SAMN02787087_00088 [Lysinibacillus sp. SG55]
MTKRRWRLVIFAAVLLIGAFIMQYREKNEDEAISLILDHATEIDAIELLQGDQSLLQATGDEAKDFIEKHPLSHVRDLSKKERTIFEEEPAYHIVYKMKEKPLYEVEILEVAIRSELDEELQQMVFTVGDTQYLVYWANEKKALEQSTNTQRLLEQFGQ